MDTVVFKIVLYVDQTHCLENSRLPDQGVWALPEELLGWQEWGGGGDGVEALAELCPEPR